MQTVELDLAEDLRLPKMRQLGIVVKDLRQAAGYYQRTFGLGPWFRALPGGAWTVERGGQTIAGELDIAVAYSGPIQLELIEIKHGEETIYAEHLHEHGEGLHHLGFSVANLDRRLARVRELGIEVLQSGVVKTAGGAVTRYAYLDTTGVGGVVIELIEIRLAGLPVGMSPWIFQLGRLTGEVERITI